MQINFCTHYIKTLNILVKDIKYLGKKKLETLVFAVHKKCPYSELFWSAFFRHFPAFGLNTFYAVSYLF